MPKIRHWLASTMIVALAACSSPGTKAPDEAPAEESVPAVPAASEHPDPGPIVTTLERAELPAEDHGEVRLDAFAMVRDGDHLFVSIPFDIPVFAPQGVHILGDTHGFAVPDAGRTRIYARLATTETPETVELTWWGRGPSGLVTQRMIINLAPARQESDLPMRFREAAAEWFTERARRASGGVQPFYHFAAGRMSTLAGRSTNPRLVSRQTDLQELMDLYTGMRSIEEALQTQRGLLIRPTPEQAKFKLTDIEGVPLPSHPWKKMIGELDSKPHVEALASAIPADMAYLRGDSLKSLILLMRDLESWASPISQSLEGQGGPKHFVDRYQRELIVEATGLAETLGHVAAKSVAVVTSDPFLREGGDLSLVFEVENAAVLETALDTFLARAKARHPQLTERRETIGNVDVTITATPDRRVHQVRAKYGDVIIVSNSVGAMKKLIDVHEKRATAMADTGEYQYFRALYPANDDAESAFLFLSDAFVAHATSPRVKILEARRIVAHADLAAVNYAALLFGWLEGRQPRNTEELLASGLLVDQELRHEHDGSLIAFDTAHGAASAWGNVAALTPIIDLELDDVTASEKRAYEAFRDGYQRYWTRFIDPIGVRFTRGDAGELAVNARILPLIDNSDYDELIALVGKTRIAPNAVHDQVRWTFAVGENARLRRDLDQMIRTFGGGREGLSLGWLGDWVMVGAVDRSRIWDLAVISGFVPGNPTPDDRDVMARVIREAPVFVGAHVKNKVALAALLAGARAYVEDTAPGLVVWGASEPYRDVPIVALTSHDQMLQDIALHYATVDDVFLASLDRTTLEIMIDEVMDHGTATTPQDLTESAVPSREGLDIQAAMQVDFAETSWLKHLLLFAFQAESRRAGVAALDAYATLYRGLGGVLDDADLRQRGLAYLGFEPQHPDGGTFSLTEKGWVTHSIAGSHADPIFTPMPPEDATIQRFFDRMNALDFELGFAGSNEHQGLHIRAKLTP